MLHFRSSFQPPFYLFVATALPFRSSFLVTTFQAICLLICRRFCALRLRLICLVASRSFLAFCFSKVNLACSTLASLRTSVLSVYQLVHSCARLRKKTFRSSRIFCLPLLTLLIQITKSYFH